MIASPYSHSLPDAGRLLGRWESLSMDEIERERRRADGGCLFDLEDGQEVAA